ncbi:MAG TPA: hypothetical protein VIW03_03515, partial [Anaeromyxobacter sp.]
MERALLDLVALPADVPRWSAGDGAAAAVVLSAGVALMLPLDDPLDARIDRWIHADLDRHLPTVWNDVMQPVLWSGIAVGGLGT